MIDKQKMLAALRWLAAHPDNHTQSRLAENDKGIPVSTGSPEATCFCALGRYAVEIGVDTAFMNDVDSDRWLVNEVWMANDPPIQRSLDQVTLKPTGKTPAAKREALTKVGQVFGFTPEEIFNVPA